MSLYFVCTFSMVTSNSFDSDLFLLSGIKVYLLPSVFFVQEAEGLLSADKKSNKNLYIISWRMQK